MTYPIDPRRALPTAAYRPSAHAAEIARVWRREWVFVGTADEVAEPGDYLTTDLGGQPVIVLRNQAGQLAALSNLCAHRGTPLLDGRGNAKRFQCPYHAWTYADDGRLLAAPFAADLDRREIGLATYRAETWHGLVFATMNPHAPPLGERLAHVAGELADAGIDRLHHWPSLRNVEEWAANWKLVIANAMESYHLFKVHPTTLEPYSPTAGAYYVVGSADATITGGAMTGGGDYRLISIPPNLVGILSDDNFGWEAVFPRGHDRSTVVTGLAVRDHPPERSGVFARLTGKAVSAYLSNMNDFLVEDRAICERVQRGAGGEFPPGPLVPMEHVITDFHHDLDRALNGASVPLPRTAQDLGLDGPTGASTAGAPA